MEFFANNFDSYNLELYCQLKYLYFKLNKLTPEAAKILQLLITMRKDATKVSILFCAALISDFFNGGFFFDWGFKNPKLVNEWILVYDINKELEVSNSSVQFFKRINRHKSN